MRSPNSSFISFQILHFLHVGASAGWGAYDPKSARGRGAVVRGTFQLQKGEVLKVLVGQEGGENKHSGGVGGGGGTFVTKTDNTPLIVAGESHIADTDGKPVSEITP
ncbi:uncharacterized protein LOC144883098 [Branchiostoma floridae x Branchiostoma japonicum]